MKRVAILGSSGGNLYNLGGKNPERLLSEILSQCNAADIEVGAVQFIGADVSMDNIRDTTKASLYVLEDNQIQAVHRGLLTEVNQEAKTYDRVIAEQIESGDIHGLILMSIDPDGANKQAIEAATKKEIPIVGTGGTAMANVGSKGANVIATSGTTGTTNRTRAISFVTSLARHWDIKYRPTFSESSGDDGEEGSIFKNISIRGIMVSSLPAFISMALILALSKIPIFSGLEDVFDLVLSALPVVIAAIAAKQISNLDEVSIVAGVIAGVLAVDGGIIGGMLAGIGAGLLVHYLFTKCVQWNFPMTTVNIVAGGLSGIGSGLVVYYFIGPVALWLGDNIRLLIESTIQFSPALAGLVAGALIWPAIIGGVYHAAILPIVLLEMERFGMSFLGAVDMVALIMVAAGINLANIVFPRDKGEAAIATPGFLINMGFGTFAESAYPFMFSNKLIFGGAIFSGALGGLVIGLFDVRGTAYLPTFVAPFAANELIGMIVAMITALVSAFIITAIVNKTSKGE